MSSKRPVSLWDLLPDRKDALSLPLGYYIALTVSLAIGAVHADGWLHESIRSDSVHCLTGDLEPFLEGDRFALEFEKRVIENLDPRRILDAMASRGEIMSAALEAGTMEADDELFGRHLRSLSQTSHAYTRVFGRLNVWLVNSGRL